jgi:hypothetical protein
MTVKKTWLQSTGRGKGKIAEKFIEIGRKMESRL